MTALETAGSELRHPELKSHEEHFLTMQATFLCPES